MGTDRKSYTKGEREVLSSPTVHRVISKALTNDKTVLNIPRLQSSIILYLLSDFWSIQSGL